MAFEQAYSFPDYYLYRMSYDTRTPNEMSDYVTLTGGTDDDLYYIEIFHINGAGSGFL